MTDLFGFEVYPMAPGWKARDTARGAAEGMKPKAPVVRDRVLNALARCNAGLTADEAADFLRLDKLTVRPRFSELASMGKVVDSGLRRPNASQKRAIVWKLAA